MVLAPNGSLWFIDPLAFRSGNGTLGVYNPEGNSTRNFKLTEPGIMAGLAMDGNGSLWMPLVDTPELHDRAQRNLMLVGVREPGVSIDGATTAWQSTPVPRSSHPMASARLRT